MENVTIGTQVKVVFGFGRTETGTVADIRTNRWGRTAVIQLDNGDDHFTDAIDNGPSTEIGCHIL